MAVVFKNNAKTTLASSLTSSATSVTVADGSALPSLSGGNTFFCTFDDGTNVEVVKVTARSSNTLTVVRAQDDTTARAFSTGDVAELRLTAGILNLFSQTGVAITDEIEAYLDANGLTFPDNVEARFGTNNDLRIYSTGSFSYIKELGTGGLYLDTNGDAIYLRGTTGNKNMVKAKKNNAVELYYDGDQKFSTTSTGIDVTGLVTIDTNPGSTYGVSEALRIDDSAGTNDRALQIFELLHSGGRSHRLTFNTNITTDGSSAYTYTQGNYGGSSQIEFGNSGEIVFFTNPQGTGGSTTAITPTERLRIKQTGEVQVQGEIIAASLDISGNVDVDGTLETDALTINGTASVPFESGDHSKLDGIEAGATADQTQSEINALGITATGLSGSPNITVGTISAGVFTTTANTGTFSNSIGSFPLVTSTPYDYVAKFESTDANAFIILEDNSSTSNANRIGVTNNDMKFVTNATTALTLNSSQNATFAGDITLANDKDIHFLKADGTNDGTKLTRAGGNAVRLKFGGNSLIFDALDDADFRVYNSGGDTIFLVDSNSTATSSSVNVVGSFKVGGTRRITNAGVLENVTTATASAGTNTTALANTAFVQQEITSLIGGAPGTLDTLNELAAAINDDSNYNSTLTTALATKLPKAGGTMSGVLNMGSQNITNASDIGMATGHSSGKFAVMATSVHGSYDFYNNGTSYFNGNVIVDANLTLSGGGQILGSPDITAGRVVTSGLYGTGHSSSILPIWQYNAGNTGYGIGYYEGSPDNISFDVSGHLMTGTPDFKISQNIAYVNGNAVWHAGNDGASSGLDADLLDGQHGSYYRNASNINAGTINTARLPNPIVLSGGNAIIKLQETDVTNSPTWWHVADGGNYSIRLNNTGGYPFQITTNSTNNAVSGIALNYATTIQGNTAWHGGNDGSGSGLDADLLDGVNSGSFLRSDAADTATGGITFAATPTLGGTSANEGGEINFGAPTGGGSSFALDNYQGHFRVHTLQSGKNFQVIGAGESQRTTINTNIGTVWGSGNDGSGSGLDADTLDGVNSGSFLRSDATDSATGALTFSGAILSNGHSSGDNWLPYTDGNFYFRAPTVIFDGKARFNEEARVITGSVAASNTTEGLMFDGNYVTGQYRHRFRKQDLNGGLPLFLDISEGTANSYTAIARFGPYLNNTQKFEVYGNSRFDGDVEVGVLTTTDSGVLYLNGSTANKRAELSCSNGNLHIDADNGNGIYLNWYGSQSAASTAGTYFGNANAGQVARIDGSGNFTLSGTVDGRDVAADGTKLDGIAAGANNFSLGSTITVSSDIQTTGGLLKFTSNNHVLTTNNTNNILFKSGTTGTMGLLGQNSGSQFRWQIYGDGSNYGFLDGNWASWDIKKTTNGQLQIDEGSGLVKVWSAGNDGSGSGLDADTLDGQHGSYYEPANTTILHQGSDISSADWNTFIDGTEASWNTVLNHSGSNRPVGYYTYGTALSFSKSGQAKFQLYASEQASSGNGGLAYRTGWNTTYRAWANLWDSANDGSGSGLDADLLDGQQGSYYAPASGANYVPSGGSWMGSNFSGSRHSGLGVNGGEIAFIRDHPNNAQMSILVDGAFFAGENNGFYSLYSGNSYNNKSGFYADTSGHLQFSGQTYAQFNTQHGYIQLGPMNTSYAHIYTNISGGFYFNRTGIYANGNTMWHAGNDGSGSGLDADLLDGLQLHTGRNNEVNKVVRTDSNGYIQTGWINTTSGARTTETITRVYASDDAYLRYYTLANFGDQIASHINYNSLENKPTIPTNNNQLTNGAAYVTSSTTRLGLDAHSLTTLNSTTLWSQPSGYQTMVKASTSSGLPSSHGQSYFGYNITSRRDTGTGYSSLLTAYDNSNMWFTYNSNEGAYPTWRKVWHDGNDGSGSGLDADNLDGYTWASQNKAVAARNLTIEAGNGQGIGFWGGTGTVGNGSYAIFMGTSGSYGRVDGETTSDYNMYFKMTAGTNRGFVFRNNTNNVVGIDSTGNLRAEADIVAYSGSDIRLKDNLTVISNPLEKLSKLSGYSFEWNSKQSAYAEGKKDIGLVAQEVEEVLPEIVKTRQDGFKGLQYEKLIPLLVEAIKEQQKQIDELKEKNDIIFKGE